MNHGDFIQFEAGIDDFVQRLKVDLRESALRLKKVSAPLCLACYLLKRGSLLIQLRIVLIGQREADPVAKISCIDSKGRERICCYLNSAFDAVLMKSNRRWVKSEKKPKESCLQTLAAIMNESRA